VNEQRWKRAEEALRANGYRFVEEQLYADLPDDARDRCIAAVYERDLSASIRMLLKSVPAPTREGTKPTPPVELKVAESDACKFFSRRVDELEATKPDGTTARLLAVPDGVRLALGPKGNLVFVVLVLRFVSRRVEIVETACNHMPRMGDAPIEVDRWRQRVVLLTSQPPTRIEMHVEHETLDNDCTENTF
jgi:hypothetical protein